MSVIMPIFLRKENQKWITEKNTSKGIIYVAKDDAPEEIKCAVKDWNVRQEIAKENNIDL